MKGRKEGQSKDAHLSTDLLVTVVISILPNTLIYVRNELSFIILEYVSFERAEKGRIWEKSVRKISR